MRVRYVLLPRCLCFLLPWFWRVWFWPGCPVLPWSLSAIYCSGAMLRSLLLGRVRLLTLGGRELGSGWRLNSKQLVKLTGNQIWKIVVLEFGFYVRFLSVRSAKGSERTHGKACMDSCFGFYLLWFYVSCEMFSRNLETFGNKLGFLTKRIYLYFIPQRFSGSKHWVGAIV